MLKHLFHVLLLIGICHHTAAAQILGRNKKVTVPAGTPLVVEINESRTSDELVLNAPIQMRVRDAVSVEGHTIIPAGASAVGLVEEITHATADIPAYIRVRAAWAVAVDGQTIGLRCDRTFVAAQENMPASVPFGKILFAWVNEDWKVQFKLGFCQIKAIWYF
jgi:hypothetical protein